uniref:Ig-like domain-containing protein n=1 Tax=Sinocyclocheilus rhinocerous TaxID=307959 RepID=A0A673GBF6_9TELE
VTLTCDTQQTGVWQYIWYKDRKLVYSSRQNQNNKIPSVDSSHSGVYSCTGTQSKAPTYSQMSDGVTLTVSGESTLTVTPKNVFTGQTVNLTCVIETYSSWRYEWYKGTDKSVMLQTSDRYTVNRDTLTIRGANEVTNKVHSTLHHCTLTDEPQPTLTVKPQSSVFTGDTVTLSCDVGQLTGWTIHWIKDSNPESTGDATKTIKSVSVSEEAVGRGCHFILYSCLSLFLVSEGVEESLCLLLLLVSCYFGCGFSRALS